MQSSKHLKDWLWTNFQLCCSPSGIITSYVSFNTLRPRRNGQHFADDIFKRIFFNENAWISIEIPLKFVPKGPIYNIPALVQIMAWRRPGDKPLSEPMMDSLPTHICVTRPQWVKSTATITKDKVMNGLWPGRTKSLPVCKITGRPITQGDL